MKAAELDDARTDYELWTSSGSLIYIARFVIAAAQLVQARPRLVRGLEPIESAACPGGSSAIVPPQLLLFSSSFPALSPGNL